MATTRSNFEVICGVVDYALKNGNVLFTITYKEGDSYECVWSNGEYVDNEEEIGSPGYEEWYEIDFHVRKILKQGPNKDPRFEYIFVSEKHMPASIVCGDKVFYQAD
jgi:hypothetical protein